MASSLSKFRHRTVYRIRRCHRLRGMAGFIACTGSGFAYLAAASWVAFGLHIGHVVQDGVDTGDVLALPLLLMAVVCFGLAMVCADAMSHRHRRVIRTS